MADYDNNGVVRSLGKVYSMFFLNNAPDGFVPKFD